VQTKEHIAVPRLEADFLVVDQDRTALTVVDCPVVFAMDAKMGVIVGG